MERHVRKGKGVLLRSEEIAFFQPDAVPTCNLDIQGVSKALHHSFLGRQPQLSFSQDFFGPLGRRNAEPCTAITTLARRKGK